MRRIASRVSPRFRKYPSGYTTRGSGAAWRSDSRQHHSATSSRYVSRRSRSERCGSRSYLMTIFFLLPSFYIEDPSEYELRESRELAPARMRLDSSSQLHTCLRRRNPIPVSWSISIGLRTAEEDDQIRAANSRDAIAIMCYDRREWGGERCRRNNQHEVLRKLLQAHLAAAAGASGEWKINFPAVLYLLLFFISHRDASRWPQSDFVARKYIDRHVEPNSIFCSRLYYPTTCCADMRYQVWLLHIYYARTKSLAFFFNSNVKRNCFKDIYFSFYTLLFLYIYTLIFRIL